MSNRSKATPDTQASNFFSINAKFLISPESTSRELQEDVACLLYVSRATVQTLIDGIGDADGPMTANPKDAVALLYGLLYQVEMVGNMVDAMEVRS